jgi:hypothetical protein
MRRLGILTAGFIVLFSALPEVLPLQAVFAVFAVFMAGVAWRVLRR